MRQEQPQRSVCSVRIGGERGRVEAAIPERLSCQPGRQTRGRKRMRRRRRESREWEGRSKKGTWGYGEKGGRQEESEGEKRYFWSCARLSRSSVNTSIEHFTVAWTLAPWQPTASLFCVSDAVTQQEMKQVSSFTWTQHVTSTMPQWTNEPWGNTAD